MYELQFVWRHSTLIIPSLIAHRKSIAASIQKLPDSVIKSVSAVRHAVNMSDEMIRLSINLRLEIDILDVMYTKYKQMLVFNIIFVLLWAGRRSSVSSAAFFLGFLELK